MREYAKKPENQSRTLDSSPKASRQAPIDVILQRNQERNIQREELIRGKFNSVQREDIDEEEILQGKFESTSEQKPVQREEKPNNTGLPDNLKTGVENLSGYSMHDVKVHYNSDKPAQLNALAYTQGTDIHVAPGQEKHLPHEAWHVVQQKQGRVQPTMQLQGVNVNDNEGLEREADVMGEDTLYKNDSLNFETNNTLVYTNTIQGYFNNINETTAHSIKIQYLSIIAGIIDKFNSIPIIGLPKNIVGKKELQESLKTKLYQLKDVFHKEFDEIISDKTTSKELSTVLNYNYDRIITQINDSTYDDLWSMDTFNEWKTDSFDEDKHSKIVAINNTLSSMKLSGKETDFQKSKMDFKKLEKDRKGNSTSLDPKSDHYDKSAVEKWENADKYVQEEASKLKGKPLTPDILFEMLLMINKIVRNESNIRFRSEGIQVTGHSTPAPIEIITIIYPVINTICNTLNSIKDENEKKDLAIRLAGMSYQMLISLHPFQDGNGRTCRFFSDFILMYVELPPATPNADMLTLYTNLSQGNIPTPFDSAYEAYQKGVSESYKTVQTKTIQFTPKVYESLQHVEEILNKNHQINGLM